MENKFLNFFSPPVFPDDDNKTRLAYYIGFITIASVLALLLFVAIRLGQGIAIQHNSNVILLSICLAMIVTWLVMKAGAIRLAGYICVTAIWIACTLLALGGSGIHGTGFVTYIIVMLLAGLLLGVRAAVWVAVLSSASGFVLAYLETSGFIIPEQDFPFVTAVELTVVFLISIVIIRLTINSLQHALAVSRTNASELQSSNTELVGLRDELELRIKERTAALEKRASQLQAVSDLARTIATVQELDALLPFITKMVSEQFGFYHVGIFLLDEAGEYAVLKAANSEGGQRMLERGHRLPLDSNSVVGYAASHGEVRITLDVGADAVYFNNPDLPETRSEMTLPLRVRGQIIGALDVQSDKTNAFSHEDISVLSTLADQVTIAIENARLFSEAQKALSDSRTTYEKYVSQSWGTFAQQARHTGFIFDGKQVLPLDNQSRQEQPKQVIQTGRLSLEKATPSIGIPIKLRGQTIGYLDVRSKKGDRAWTRDEITLLEAAAERAALALENARLVESAQRRAARERAIGDISTKIGALNSFEYIMQTAVEELGRKIGGATEVTLEIGSVDDQNH
jgi:GAF domain-containing protein